MSKYLYEFQRFGALFRQRGVTMTDAFGNYISGRPEWVPWWPINWFVIAIGIPVMGVRQLLRRRRRHD